ncbi:class I SAM-dependent methyltransferase [Actibacterium ureilyticum]|uniref:class I SAM-dependent methyltransferase n=1 Tax=Actibacterium ureilyticum TaxID=1590614 RepID=UPI000BAAFE9C|nr:class I SAM-dependent methyltransferase [Actibacterium ureilyticum]
MADTRLTLMLDADPGLLPPAGRIAVFAPTAAADLSALPQDRVHVIQGFKPDHDAWAARGYDCAVAPVGDYAAAVVFVPRAKDLARMMVAQAAELVPDGVLLIDGQKTDGIDSLFKASRARAECSAAVSKSHGKIFAIHAPGDGFGDWRAGAVTVPGGFVTAPGVFSADGVDPASALLADALPATLKGCVADLGAGWGYLSARALERPGITQIDLVEADHTALDCARRNVTDPRARFHWADATAFGADRGYDAVITNPPFHTGRAADPGLGVAFLRNAARILRPGGALWLVANRQLPYERALGEFFAKTEEIGGDNRFKLLCATGPQTAPRRGR